MFNLDKFIADSVTFRPVSMFGPDIQASGKKQARPTGQEAELTVNKLTN